MGKSTTKKASKKASKPKPDTKAKKPESKSRVAVPKATNPKPSTRVAVPWKKIKEMWDAGKPYLEIAKATDPHFDSSKADATKTTRAKISVGMNKGVKIDGKLVHFKRRERTKDAVVGEKVSTEKPQSKPKQVKAKSSNTAKTETTGKEVKVAEPVKPAEPIKPAVESKEVEAAKPTVTN